MVENLLSRCCGGHATKAVKVLFVLFETRDKPPLDFPVSLFLSAMSTRRSLLQWRSPSQIIARPGGKHLRRQHPCNSKFHPQVSEQACPISTHLLEFASAIPNPKPFERCSALPLTKQGSGSLTIDSVASRPQREIDGLVLHDILYTW